MPAHNQRNKGHQPRVESPNCVTSIAQEHGRNFIVPSDIAEAFARHSDDPHLVRIDVLEVLGRHTTFGVESPNACARVAWQGKEI